MGEMKRAIAYEDRQGQKHDRYASTLVIAASLIAVVRLAREPDIGSRSPHVDAAISESVSFAKMILDQIVR